MSEPGIIPKRRPGLGRGLSALLGDAAREEPLNSDSMRSAGVQTLAIATLKPNPFQPRRHFDDAALDELASSIATRGMIQPILVRPRGAGYEIIAGERRWRAAQRAHVHEVPVIIREFDDSETLEVALLENIQREDLNPLEEAEAYQRLIAEYGHTQEALGRIVHKSRSHVANLMRLLDLPPPVRAAVADGRLTMGHARALITADDPEALAEEVIRRDLSVRDTEKLARGSRPAAARRQGASSGKSPDADIAALERQLADLLGLKVTIAHGLSGGTVSIAYSTLDQLDMVCQRLSGEPI